MTGVGSLGGNFEFYDATTTDVNLRTGNLATSTIFLGSFPNNIATGTYLMDINFARGLTMVWTAGGTVASTTITTR